MILLAKRATVCLLDFAFWLGIQMPLLMIAVLFKNLDRFFLNRYYDVVRLRRLIKNEPLWQQHDILLGRLPPKD